MPRRVPGYRHHKPSGQAVVTLGGQDYYLGKYGSPESRRKYDELVAGWLTAKTAPPRPSYPPGAGGAVTVNQLLLAWFREYAEPRYQKAGKATGQLNRAKQAIRAARLRHGTTAATNFRAPELAAVRLALVMADHARNYVNSLVSVLKTAFIWGAEHGLVSGEAAYSLRAVRGLQRGAVLGGRQVKETERVKPAPLRDVETALAIANSIVRDLARIQHLCGMRPCEALGLRWQHVNRDGQLADGQRFEDVWVYEVPDDANKNAHKDQARVVFFGPKAQSLLQSYGDVAPDRPVFALEPKRPATKKTRGYLVRWQASPNRHYATGVYDRAIREVCALAKIKPFTPNQLRHLRATEIRAGYSLDAARAVLGHRAPGMTGRYAEDDLALAAKVMREIG